MLGDVVICDRMVDPDIPIAAPSYCVVHAIACLGTAECVRFLQDKDYLDGVCTLWQVLL